MLDAIPTAAMGRKMKYPEKAVGAFPSGTFAAIERVTADTEDRTDFIRTAVERELERRGTKRVPGEKPSKDAQE